ncbi:MAG: MAPEG family protein [Rhizomicrobium sp.]
MTSMLTPVLALIVWTLIVWTWMYATRIPAMQRARIDPQSGQHPGSLDVLPSPVRQVADNYNHLMEQPTIFYALAFTIVLAGPHRHAACRPRLGLCRAARGPFP